MTRVIGCAWALCFLAFQAHASPEGTYFGATIGNSQQHLGKGEDINVLISSPFAPNGGITKVPTTSRQSDQKDRSLGAFVGYRFNSFVAAELGYADFGDAAVTDHYQLPEDLFPIGAPEITRSFSTNISGPTISALGILPLGSQFDAFVRVGLLFADQQVRLEGSGSRPEDYADTVWVGGLGVDYHFTRRWSARLEYQRTDTIDAPQGGSSNRLSQFALSFVYSLKAAR